MNEKRDKRMRRKGEIQVSGSGKTTPLRYLNANLPHHIWPASDLLTKLKKKKKKKDFGK